MNTTKDKLHARAIHTLFMVYLSKYRCKDLYPIIKYIRDKYNYNITSEFVDELFNDI